MSILNFIGRYLTAAAVAAYTLTLGLLSARRRAQLSQLARSGGYPEFPRRQLPTVAISSLTNNSTAVTLPFPEGADGNVSLLELLTLARLVAERRPTGVFEIGTFNGRTTLALAANAPDAAVYTLDLPAGQASQLPLAGGERAFVDKPVSGELFRDTQYAKRITALLGDSAAVDFAPYSVDFVFIDGSHAYEYVLNDSAKALGMLRNGRGTLVWHDYGEWPGVTRALNELYRSDARFAGLRHIENTTLAILLLSSRA